MHLTKAMAASRAKRTTKITPDSVEGEIVSPLQMGTPKKNPLRERTEDALQRKADKHAAHVAAQVKAFYEAMEPIADQGLCKGEYRKDLCEDARKQLRAQGITIVDHGENVCSLYLVSW